MSTRAIDETIHRHLGAARMRPRWAPCELDALRNLWPDVDAIVEATGRTPHAVKAKARVMKGLPQPAPADAATAGGPAAW